MTRLAAFFLVLLALALGMDRSLGLYDEGVILTGAMRAAAGDVPHAGFYTNYGPGVFYPIAILFRLFGETVWVERLYDTAIRAGIVMMAYALVAGVAPRRIAVAVAAASFLWVLGIGFYGYPLFPVTLLALLAAALIQPALVGDAAARRLFFAGAVVALAALTRYDVGFVLFIGLGVSLAAAKQWRAVAMYIVGTAVLFLGAVAVYASFAPLGPFWHDIFLFSIPNYAPMRSLPFPGLQEIRREPENIAVYTTIVTCIALVALLATDRRGFAARSRAHWLALTFTVLATLFYMKGLVRVSPIHLMSSIFASLIALGAIAHVGWIRGGGPRVAVAILALAAAIPALQSTASAVVERAARHRFGFTLLSLKCLTPPEMFDRVGCFMVDSDRLQAYAAVARNTAPGERVFVGLGRHDKIHVNDVLSYFAMGRMPATRWHHFDSGLQTSEPIQREMVRELESLKVRFVILETTWDHIAEPNGSGISSDVRVLDDYLRARYRAVAQFGEVYVLERSAP